MTKREKKRDEFAKSLRRAVIMMEYYHYFSARETNAELLKGEACTPQEAENLARLAQLLIKDREVSPSEFIREPDDLANKVLEYDGKMIKMRHRLEIKGIDEEVLNQLCKDVEEKDEEVIPGMRMYAQAIGYFLKVHLDYLIDKAFTKGQMNACYLYYTSKPPFIPKNLYMVSRRLVRDLLNYYERLSKFNSI